MSEGKLAEWWFSGALERRRSLVGGKAGETA